LKPRRSSYKVLVVDDDRITRETLGDALSRGDLYKAVLASGVAEAKMRLAGEDIDIVLADLKLKDGSGLEVLEESKKLLPNVPVIVVTGHGNVEIAEEAVARGAHTYVDKPVTLPRLRATLGTAVRELDLATENLELHRRLESHEVFERMVGVSPQMTKLFTTIGQVARTDAAILIQGESGTGKELVADAIQALSERASGPFIKVNVAVLPRELIESELFGHEQGAFTGAHRRRKGRFELADGGTLFLDEIGEMPLDAQVKLLRVLEERSFERIGGTESIKVDIRLLAATNRDLAAAMRSGAFRQDLYYRINVVTIRIPPLRERREDVAPLVGFYLKNLSSAGKPKRMSREALDAMVAYDWPGNARELRNAVERAVIVTPGGEIQAGALPEEVGASRSQAPPRGRAGEAGGTGGAEGLPVPSGTLDDVEREAIGKALAACGGNKTAAAKSLGIGLKTLYRKIEKYAL